jgi:hypothetical protein
MSSNLADTADRGPHQRSAPRGQPDASEALAAMVATLETWQAERGSPGQTKQDRGLDGVDLSAFKKLVCLRGECRGLAALRLRGACLCPPGAARVPVPARHTE